jgi:imidazolonepropionase-like amidohydrolase
MHRFLRVAAVSLLLLAPLGTPLARSLVLRNATVVDVADTGSRANATIVIDGDRIVAIGDPDTTPLPAGAEVVDGTGKFAIPGLWDMHAHWQHKESLPLFVANGVTGIRIMWGMPLHHRWRREIEQGSLLGPRMVIASSIIDGPKPFWQGSVAVGTADEAREAVRQAKQAGADFVKVYDRLPREAFFAIADEAKQQNLPFAGHVPSAVSPAEAASAGMHSIEHLTGILTASSTRKDDLLREPPAPSGGDATAATNAQPRTKAILESFSPDKANALFAEFVRHRTWQSPTLTVLRSSSHLDDPGFRRDPRIRYLPAEVTAFWDPKTDARFQKRTTAEYALARQVYEKQMELVGMMHRAGVEILAGTDALNPYCFPGFSLPDELELLVESGLKPLDALRAATLNPARFLGKEQDFGTVDVGKVADLVLLGADPLVAIGNVRKVDAVVVGGRLLDRAALDEMLARAEVAAARPPVPPLPDDLAVFPPAADVARDIAAFSGKWSGQWEGALDHVLVVTRIEGRNATLIYSWGMAAAQGIRPGFTTIQGTFDESGDLRATLQSGSKIAYRLSQDRQSLAGEFIRENFKTRGNFRRQ